MNIYLKFVFFVYNLFYPLIVFTNDCFYHIMLVLMHMGVICCYDYLAQKLCFWTGIIFIGVYVSVCLSVCVCVLVDYLKKFLTDFDETWQDDV